MIFYPFEVTIPHIIYACLGGFIVLFGMFSLFLREKLYISEACWSFLFGVIIGPYCADIFNPRAWSDSQEQINGFTLEFTRVVLAIGVFAIGVELPKAYMARHWRSLFFLLVPVMTWGWLVSAGLIYALIPGLNFLSSLAVAACLTPTDPILAAAVIGGKWADKHVPAHIRHLLAAESGCNDGAAFPFLFLALYLILDSPNTGIAMRDWFLFLWLYQVVLGALIGALLGFGFRYLMKFCERMDLIDRHSYVAQYVSLAMFTIGVTTLLGSDDLLAAFACGTAFAWDGFFNRQTEESVFSSVIDLLFNVAAFIFVGAWMPFNKFQDAELTLSVWRLIVIAILVLLLRRLPIMIALYRWIPDVKNFREALFSGHFGPIGIGAIFISTFATEIIHNAHKTAENSTNYDQLEMLSQTIQPIVAFMVLCSITIHGLSIPSFSLGRRVHSVGRTWSRHATATSGSMLAPEWTHHATLVRRGDEIVINRDPGDIDLERGLGTESEKTREGSAVSSEELRKEKQQEKTDSTPGEGEETDNGTTLAPAPSEVRFADEDSARESKDRQVAAARSPRESPSTPSTPVGIRTPERAFTASRTYSISELPLAVESQPPTPLDYREQNLPDGGRLPKAGEGDEVTEWQEGSQKVIERRSGPGGDVDVIVVRDPQPRPSTSSRMREAVHGLEHTVSNELIAAAEGLHGVGRRARDVISPTHRSGSNVQATHLKATMKRRTSGTSSGAQTPNDENRETAGESSRIQERTSSSQGVSSPLPVVASGDDDDGVWASEASDDSSNVGHGGPGSKHQSKRTRVGHAFKTFALGRKRRGSSIRRAGHDEEEDESRGRERITKIPAPPGSGGKSRSQPSAILPPSGFAGGVRRGEGAEASGSGIAGLRHHRLNRLLSDRPPTRDSSPARSVRFLDSNGGTSGTRTPTRLGGTETPPSAGASVGHEKTVMD